MIVPDVEAAVRFLVDVFGATGEVVAGRPADVVLGDSLVMVSDGRAPFPAMLYVYVDAVDDVDATYERAVTAGAETIEAPVDQPYGDRRAMVQDPQGNVFQIACPLPT